MDLDQLKQILELVREHELSEFEIEQEGLRAQGPEGREPAASWSSGALAGRAGRGAAAAGAAAPAAPAAATARRQRRVRRRPEAEADIELAVVKSPIVGTFYRSPEPGAPSVRRGRHDA